MKNKKQDGRQKDRVALEEKVKIVCEDMNRFLTEYADNISAGGMFIKTKNPLPTGTSFNLELTISGTAKKISGVGEVVWTKEYFSDKDSRPSGMGIRFIELFGDSKAFIQELLEEDPA